VEEMDDTVPWRADERSYNCCFIARKHQKNINNPTKTKKHKQPNKKKKKSRRRWGE
jgi:hypothetical protein